MTFPTVVMVFTMFVTAFFATAFFPGLRARDAYQLLVLHKNRFGIRFFALLFHDLFLSDDDQSLLLEACD